MNEYTCMSAKGEGRSQVFAQIVGDVIKVQPNGESGFTFLFDKKPTHVHICISLTADCFSYFLLQIIDPEERHSYS